MSYGNRHLIGLSAPDGLSDRFLGEHIADKYKFMHLSLTEASSAPAELLDQFGSAALILQGIARYASTSSNWPGGLVISGVQTAEQAVEIKENYGILLYLDTGEQAGDWLPIRQLAGNNYIVEVGQSTDFCSHMLQRK